MLRAAASAYGLGVRARAWAYRAGLLRAVRARVPVVCVGNLTAGGSGKTPVTAWLARRIAARGKRVAVVSRGYGGSIRGPRAVSGGGGLLLSAREAGDEPVLLARILPGVPVVVARRRAQGALLAVEGGAQALVLDDGYQHFALERDLDLLLVHAGVGFGNGLLLPAGPLRETVDGLRRADLVWITHAEQGIPPPLGETLDRWAPGVPRVKSAYRPARLREAAGGGERPLAGLEGAPLAGVAGIAHPEDFWRTIEGLGGRLVARFPFPDHHPFAPGEILEVARKAKAAGAEALVTTEKDAARWEGDLPPLGLPWLSLGVEVEVLEGVEAIDARLAALGL